MKMLDLLQGMCNPNNFKIEYCSDYSTSSCDKTCYYANKLEKKVKVKIRKKDEERIRI